MKADVLKIPMLSMMIKMGDCLTVSGDKNKLIKEIDDRQKHAEEGKFGQLIIHAEGGTTNGNMIKFQKGAFLGMNAIMPKAVKYNTYGLVSPSSGILDGFAHHVLVCAYPLCIVDFYEMPVFKPNDFFFEHHQLEGEEKWETYARVIRDIISENGGIPIVKHEDGSEIDIREKQEYKNLLWPKKQKKN